MVRACLFWQNWQRFVFITAQGIHVAELQSQNKKLSDNGSELSRINANLLKMLENFQKNEKTAKAALTSHQTENAKLAKSAEHLQGLLTETQWWAEPHSCVITDENNAAYLFSTHLVE